MEEGEDAGAVGKENKYFHIFSQTFLIKIRHAACRERIRTIAVDLFSQPFEKNQRHDANHSVLRISPIKRRN